MDMSKIKCIMLLDDNEADNEYHKIIIERSGTVENVITFSSSIKALEYLTKCYAPESNPGECLKPDLIFLDINMPAMNGYEFLDKLKQLPIELNKQLKIIVLTGSLNPEDATIVKETFKNEVADFKIKPITVEMLQELKAKFFEEVA